MGFRGQGSRFRVEWLGFGQRIKGLGLRNDRRLALALAGALVAHHLVQGVGVAVSEFGLYMKIKVLGRIAGFGTGLRG